jgi:O-antigen ligase
MNVQPRVWVAALYLVLCLVLGGASAAGAIANFTIQFIGALILLAVALKDPRREVTRAEKGAWLLFFAFILLSLLQLVPLPPAIWTALPGRSTVAEGFTLVGAELPWLPLSLTPDGTIRAMVSLLPGLAILALLSPASARSRHRFLPLIVSFAFIALLLGLTQKASGSKSALYFYSVTNWGHTVGFFANRNHQATLLLMTLPFVAALATPLLRGGKIRQDAIPKIVVIATLFFMIAGGVVMTGSRAGVAILPIITAFCVLMVRKDLTGNVPKLWIGGVGLFMLAAIAGVGFSGVVTRDALATANVAASTREAIWDNSWRYAVEHLPAGSGLGSFVPVFRVREDPLNRPSEFANHAHNDYLEWLLETGLPGIALLVGFAVWYAFQLGGVWRSNEAALGRAGSIAIGAVLIHSLADYPIRTAAIFAMAALCAAFMIPAPADPGEKEQSRSRRRERRHRP